MRLAKDDPRRRELVVQFVGTEVFMHRYSPDEARRHNADHGWTGQNLWWDEAGRWHIFSFRGVRLTESELQTAFYQSAVTRQRIARIWQSVLG